MDPSLLQSRVPTEVSANSLHKKRQVLAIGEIGNLCLCRYIDDALESLLCA